TIIAGVLILGGGGYFGFTQYQTYQAEKINKEKITQEAQQQKDSEVENLKQKVEGLKKEQVENARVTQNELTNAAIIKAVKHAIVYIESPYGSGSGMIFTKDGYILTNAHVVKETASVKVYLIDRRSFTISAMSYNEDADIAILKIDANNLPVVVFGDSNVAQRGDEVFTFGYPFGIKGDVSFKEGTISRKLVDSGLSYIETSAEIHPGNSGGPLVDKLGKVVGINTLAVGKSINGIILGESIKFAISINVAKDLIPKLKLTMKSTSLFTAECANQKARGLVTVFNLNSTPQIIITSTRITPPAGLIFRVDKTIVVPSAQVTSVGLVPGQREVSITADKIGSEYKIGPSTFSVPGLIGSDRYDKVYAKSSQPTICN
ncbi:MAG: trypsin-like peptidase domain-containing protein, partial [bacterium]|nr:trypsin-like peptidase domain-containing protein [bacterium]